MLPMPILPIIDLLILLGWTSLLGGFVLKAVYITTTYRPTVFGLGPLDLLMLAAVFLLFSLALAARSWVKAHEDRLLSASTRAAATLEAYAAVRADKEDRAGRAGSEDGVGMSEAPGLSTAAAFSAADAARAGLVRKQG
jgi:hypothetical protein